jgi:hypothetical protein
MIHRPLAAVALLIVVSAFIAPGVSSAAPHEEIGPQQVFTGSVNGSPGTPKAAVIRVVCDGPVMPEQTGHPLPRQTVEVNPASSVDSSSGLTGKSATSITTFFGAPPPDTGGPGEVTFRRYGVAKSIPTDLDLPCFGMGVVTFLPLAESPPTSRSMGVPVEYDNIAVNGK